MKEVNLIFIYAPKCEHCKQMEVAIESAVELSKIPCNITKFLYTNRAAVKIAMKNGIDDLPGLVVGTGGSFCGSDYDEARIVEAIQKASDTWKKKKQTKPTKKKTQK